MGLYLVFYVLIKYLAGFLPDLDSANCRTKNTAAFSILLLHRGEHYYVILPTNIQQSCYNSSTSLLPGETRTLSPILSNKGDNYILAIPGFVRALYLFTGPGRCPGHPNIMRPEYFIYDLSVALPKTNPPLNYPSLTHTSNMPLSFFTNLLGLTNPTSNDDFLKTLLESPNVEPGVLVADLVKRGFNIETEFGEGMRALHFAAFFGRAEIVEVLISYGVDMEARCEKGKRAVHYAAFGRKKPALHELLSRGATVNCVDNEEFTPLHYACGKGDLDCVRTLLDFGANIEAKDHESATPLRRAAARGNIHVVRLLLERGADKTARVPSGVTMAKASGIPAVRALLRR